MGTLSETGKKPGEIVFRVNAQKRRWRRSEWVPLGTRRAKLHIEALEVIEGIKFGGGKRVNRLILRASTRPEERTGIVFDDPGYDNFVGGPGERTYEFLEKLGLIPVLKRDKDGDVVGVSVVKK